MGHHLIRVTGIIITLTLLLAVFVEPACARQARHEPGETTPISSDDKEQVEDTALVCLALIGGTALLAGGVWMRKLRMITFGSTRPGDFHKH